MVRHLRVIASVLLPLWIPAIAGLSIASLPACGGGKKAPKDPALNDGASKKRPPPPETEEDREKKRMAAAKQIVPEGSNCLPDALKEPNAPRLELAAINGEAVICAIDNERDRMLGPVACWKVDVQTGDLEYQKPAPIPGRGFPVKLVDRCARGYCLPKDAKGDGKAAYMAWNPDGSKVALHVGDEIHLFDASSKARESSFPIRGDKGVASDPTALYWVGDVIFVEASDGNANSPVWAFKAADGAQMGALEGIGKGAKPLSTHGGSFVILDEARIAVTEQGFTSVVTYEVASGKRAKLVRKLPKTPCKAEETEAYWKDQMDKVPAKCKEHMTKNFGPLVGADAVAGKKNLLVLLRDARLGEMAVMDAKTLAEAKAIRLPWCSDEGGGGEKPAKGEKSEKSEKPEKPAKGEKSEKPEKPAKGDKAKAESE